MFKNDRELVIDSLRKCILDSFVDSDELDKSCVEVQILRLAVEQLERLTPIKPICGSKNTQTPWVVCGQCTEKLERQFMFCPCCGRKVKWDD